MLEARSRGGGKIRDESRSSTSFLPSATSLCLFFFFGESLLPTTPRSPRGNIHIPQHISLQDRLSNPQPSSPSRRSTSHHLIPLLPLPSLPLKLTSLLLFSIYRRPSWPSSSTEESSSELIPEQPQGSSLSLSLNSLLPSFRRRAHFPSFPCLRDVCVSGFLVLAAQILHRQSSHGQAHAHPRSSLLLSFRFGC